MNLNNILKRIDINSQISIDRWLSIKQTIEYSGLSDSTIRRAIRKGVLKAGNRGGKLLFKKENIDSWIKGN
ncbi:helix-turn-helix domain-containing protein [Candidatus Marinimicrobia bacterium]|nr:helix-turn-helix domain-containing protein [Candidatus Neomarinimicrobiota bacterium]